MDPNDEDEVVSNTASAVTGKKTPTYPGPKPGVNYPLTVIYCGECTLPVDLCENSTNAEACKEWLEKNHPDFYTQQLANLQIADSESAGEDSGKKHQKRGGKSLQKPKKEKVPSKIFISKDKRRGNKYVTIILGLAANEIDLEVARKFFAQRFACACSKSDKDDELVIQGDVVDKLFDTILEKFPHIQLKMIEEKVKPAKAE